MTIGHYDMARTDAKSAARTLTRDSEVASWPQAPTHPKSSMIPSKWNAHDGADEQLEFFEDLSAEMAELVYQLALRQGLGDRWLTLRLALWESLTESIATSDC